MATRMNLELKVGIFAFIALVILTLAVFSISEIRLFHPGYLIKVVFSFASGLDVGAQVRVAGIKVGEVKAVELGYDKEEGRAKVVLSVWIDQGVELPQDSRAFINILGLIGERYLEIIPGQDYAHLLKEGDILQGQDALSTDSLLEVVHKVASNFERTLNSINEVLDVQTKAELKETIHNFRDFSQSWRAIAEHLEREEVAAQFTRALNSINEVLDVQTKADLKETIHNFRSFSKSLSVITERLEQGEGKLGRWLKPRQTSKKQPEAEELKD